MRLARWGAQVGVAVLGVVAATTCQFSDVLTTPGVENVVLSYSGDTILVVGSAAIPSARAEVDGAALPRAQFHYASSDTSIVAVRTGDSLLAKRRGTVTLTVTLASAVLPSDPPEITQTVRAVIDTLVLDSTSVTFSSLGDTVRLLATALDAEGNTVGGATAAWESADTAVVSVTPSGRLQARRNGTAAVRAVVDLDTAVVAVTVQQELVRYTFEPQSLRLDALGAQASATATGRDARGFPIASVPPAWSIGDDAIALVGAVSGVVTAIAEGETYLYATRGEVTDSVSLVVDQRATRVVITPDPVPPISSLEDEVQLTARAFDRINQELQTTAPIWFTLDPGRVRVSSVGLVTALGTGVSRVVARLDDGADTANVSISNDPASVVVTPDTAQAMSVGDTVLFTATVRNAREDIISGAPVSWRTPDSTVVRVQPGRGIAMSVGVARVIASAAGGTGTVADTGLMRVTNDPAELDILPGSLNLTSLGEVDTPAVAIKNARGAMLPRGSVTWSSDDADIARVSPIGQVQARDTGQTFVRAASGFLEDSILVIVTNVPRAINILGRQTDTLTALGQQLTFRVQVFNGRDHQIPGYLPGWRSTNASVIDSVTSEGIATAVGYGTADLIARAETVEDTVRVVVFNPTQLYVDNSFVPSPRVGTGSRPYAKIQDAVDAADANDTVIVRRGSAPYSETVALTRRLTLLGDSMAFVGTGRDPASLPLIAHDTGAAGITAYTTAPMTVKYLALRHTLDGPAIDADGSDLVIDYFFVNRTSGVTSRIGRGISIANSPSGTRITNSAVDSVRGYGIQLVNVSGAVVRGNTIRGIDSLSFGAEEGAGIEVSGGSGNTVESNTIRATQGPRVLVSSAVSTQVRQNNLAGRHRLVRIAGASGATVVDTNTLDLRFQAGDDGQGSQFDGRAGVEIETSTDVVVGRNTFVDTTTGLGVAIDAIRLRGAGHAWLRQNAFSGGRYVFVTEGSSWRADLNAVTSAIGYVLSSGPDTITIQDDTVSLTGTRPCVDAVADFVVVTIRRSQFTACGQTNNVAAVLVRGLEDVVTIDSSRIAVADRPAVNVQGRRFQARGSTFYGGGSTRAHGAPGAITVDVDTLSFIRNFVLDFGSLSNGLADLGTTFARVDSNVIARNRIGYNLLGTVSNYEFQHNDVYDNSRAGVFNESEVGLGLPNNWWGDARGPRGASDPPAVGDSTEGVSVNVTPLGTTPLSRGSPAAGLRIVRGNRQNAAAGTTLAQAFSVRVVDQFGRPVSDVDVTFTASGGTLSTGTTTGASVVARSNASGLAEATLTLEATPGTNTVQASGTGIGTVTFTATGTL